CTSGTHCVPEATNLTIASASGTNHRDPAVAFVSAASNQFIVTWTNVNVVKGEWVPLTGSPGTAFTVNPDSYNSKGPDVAYDSSSQKVLFTWMSQVTSTSNWDLRVRQMNAPNQQWDTVNYWATSSTQDDNWPAIATDPKNHGWIITWNRTASSDDL